MFRKHDAHIPTHHRSCSLFNMVYRIASEIGYFMVGDTYQMIRSKAEFATGELYDRARKHPSKMAIGYGPLWLPLMLVVATPDLMKQVARYGEKAPNVDPRARDDLEIVTKLTGIKTLATTMGKEAAIERQKIAHTMTYRPSINKIFQHAVLLIRNVETWWQNNKPLSFNMAFFVANMVGRGVDGVPGVPVNFIHFAEDLEKIFLTQETSSPIVTRFQQEGDAIIEKYADDIARSGKFIFQKANITEKDDKETMIKKLRATRGMAGILATGNLTAAITAGHYFFTTLPPEDQEKLYKDFDNINIESLLKKDDELKSKAFENWDVWLQEMEIVLQKTATDFETRHWPAYLEEKAPHLFNFYRETLRILCPGAVVARKTSPCKQVTLIDAEGKEQKHHFLAPVRLFGLPARMGRDELYWQHPEKFNPSRFEGMDRHDPLYHLYKLTFSVGERDCPAAAFLAPMGFYVGMMLRAKYDLGFDTKANLPPSHSPLPRLAPIKAELSVRHHLSEQKLKM